MRERKDRLEKRTPPFGRNRWSRFRSSISRSRTCVCSLLLQYFRWLVLDLLLPMHTCIYGKEVLALTKTFWHVTCTTPLYVLCVIGTCTIATCIMIRMVLGYYCVLLELWSFDDMYSYTHVRVVKFFDRPFWIETTCTDKRLSRYLLRCTWW